MIHYYYSSMVIMLGVFFVVGNHPLWMGLILLVQTFLVSLFSGFLLSFFWFSYILFLLFLGGMLVLFMYVCGLASNEMFMFDSIEVGWGVGVSLLLMWAMYMYAGGKSCLIVEGFDWGFNLDYKSLFLVCLVSFYSYPYYMLIGMLAVYLLVGLVAVSSIVDLSDGPLRSSGKMF
uniref:NADH-ubiquinone oxidoreductase chain 6 n=1 Tax=Challia fletcheri TaxID=1091408 RepID=J7F0B5_9NEOP|nr:NADH dehydrogenase subunit 6 [Challia fletcheri]AEP83058.1 NADH dehydrogenase subunit 6 [Challia fletcheri]